MALPVTRDEFLSFLNNKVKNPACEACGTTNWIVPEVDKGMLVSVPLLQQQGFSIPPPAVPAAVAVCSNCGNLRFHAIGIVKPQGDSR